MLFTKKIFLLGLNLILTGCALPSADFKEPINGPTAQIIIDTDIEIAVNKPVYFHGSNICNYDSAQLVGFVSKSNGPLLFKDEVVNSTVVAEKPIFVSLPLDYVTDADITSVTITYLQPVFTFVPKENASYKVLFSSEGAKLFSIDKQGKLSNISSSGSYYNGCKSTTANQGNGVKAFYLKP
ncbi:hypothetical protein ERW51_18505 [Aliivibrio finisterrensis]|uniref:hypothetical protein n=1 Tax=Vibrionaceae TaxID=641 RepID=UPI00080E6356|nr:MULTISPECIES: hypothetical protein [Vibrionaceae]OCH23951.1 hypothetical protein A6E12_18620 [Aliivibrio fischeri]RYU65804.1 hypothetical protein ERW51_18505 [Aliivibrio finisterrensis]RYU69189.1 hypothetical protein ERW48_19080 [Aliivibrio finisterrensis]TKF90032.1 hypothetical protein FCV73_14580 [Vibrio sp. F13]